MCLHSLHSTVQENHTINNRYDHCFELLFGCSPSRATILFRLLQQSAHRRSRKWNMMVQLVQRDWRVRLSQMDWMKQKWVLSISHVCTPALNPFKPSLAEKFTMSAPKCLTPNPSHLFALLQILFLKNFPLFLKFWAFSKSASCLSDVFHFTQQQKAELSLCRSDRSKVTEPPLAWSLRFIQSLSCRFVDSWHTRPSSLSSVRSSAFYLCWRVAGTFKTLCASLKVCI